MANKTKLTDLTIIDAIERADLFAPWFKKRFFQKEGTWDRWISFLRVLFGLDLGEQDLELFRKCTGRSDVPDSGFTEAWLVCGRRAGKSFIISLVAVFLACFIDWRPYLQHGERGTIAILAKDRAQCQTIFRYIARLIEGVRVLKPLITRQTNELIELSNGINIEITTASFQTIRGRTVIAGLCDEIAFWASEGSNPDSAVLSALRPAMGTIPGAVLLCASSPYARRGTLFDHHGRYYGKNGSDVLIWQSATTTMNPTFSQRTIDAAMAKDPADARAEYYAEFRTDIESFVDRALIDSLIVPGRIELAPLPDTAYHAFVDPAGGSGSDSMTLAIAHKDSLSDLAVLDAVREIRPPFSPADAVAEFVSLLKTYRVEQVTGDHWGGAFVRQPFEPIEYSLSKQSKSDIYRDTLPLLNSRRVQLLDHPRLVSQLCGLERRTARGGRDSIDHPPNSHDDICNSVCGALLLASTAEANQVKWAWTSASWGPTTPRPIESNIWSLSV